MESFLWKPDDYSTLSSLATMGGGDDDQDEEDKKLK